MNGQYSHKDVLSECPKLKEYEAKIMKFGVPGKGMQSSYEIEKGFKEEIKLSDDLSLRWTVGSRAQDLYD
jgi:hypothetical protein